MTIRRPSRRRERRMLLRNRVALTTALVVALSIAGVSVSAWVVTAHILHTQLDDTLTRRSPPPLPVDAAPSAARLLCSEVAPGQQLQRYVEGVQLLRPDGSACVPAGVDPVVTAPADLAVTGQTLRDGTTRSGVAVRVLVQPVGADGVLLTSRSTAEIDSALTGLRAALVAASLVGVAIAGAAGLLLTHDALRPMARLTGAAERIASTQDLETPVEITGRDEVGRLSRAFAAMTDALTESRRRQQDLITDAAHELRTPLTSLRTNIDLLVRSASAGRALSAQQYADLVTSLQTQAGEFGELVSELVALARDQRTFETVAVRVHVVVERALRRAESRSLTHRLDVQLQPWTTIGDAGALERCVVNLLDNAIKFSPPGSVVTVRTEPGWFTVADQGPGIAEAHRASVFDRFWRAPAARSQSGSGLGLAIVADIAAAHGGRALLDAPAEGTRVRVELPVERCDGSSMPGDRRRPAESSGFPAHPVGERSDGVEANGSA